jgi:hypothetical protein
MCPASLGDHALDSVELFDGPPTKLIGIHPGWGGWPLYKWHFPEGVFLVCRYRDTSDTRELRLPDGVRACWFNNHWPHVICR